MDTASLLPGGGESRLFSMQNQAFYAERNRLYRGLPYAQLILNLGCGSGSFPRYYPYENSFIVNIDSGLEEHAGWPAWGIQQKGWQRFKQLTNHVGRLKNIDGDIRNLSLFPNCLFDMIIMGEVIEHVSLLDAHITLEEIYRVTRRDGVLQIDTPNKECTTKEYKTDHMFEYTESELRRLIEIHGFSISHLKKLNIDYGFWLVARRD